MGNWCTSNDKLKGGYHDKPPKVRRKPTNLTSEQSGGFEESAEEILDQNLDLGSLNTRSSTIKVASLESFNTLKLIGKGSYGRVFLVEQKTSK